MELVNLDSVMAVLDEYAKEVRNSYQDNLIRSNRIASGDLLNSVEYIIENGDMQIEVKLKLEDYWKYTEYGTRPHWPPVNQILEWIRIKPVIPRPDANGKIPTPQQLAYLIGRKIARYGTTGTGDLQTALDKVNGEYKSRLQEALQKDLFTITNIIFTDLKG